MRTVQWPDGLDGEAEFVAWRTRADAAAKAAAERVERGEAPDVSSDDQVWRDGKRLLAGRVYGRKCGYCEFDMLGGAFGHADHFRPKGRLVQRRAASARTPVLRSDGTRHTGYWWLAFDALNIVPACDQCNVFKSSQFPVHGERAEGPADGDDARLLAERERPLLMHPVLDDPEASLVFDRFGGISARDGDRRAEETIKVCRLDRSELETRRAKQLRTARRALRLAFKTDEPEREVLAAYAGFTAHDEAFSVAVRQHLDELIASGELAPDPPAPVP